MPEPYRVAAASMLAEHPMGEAHALRADDTTLCGLTAPPLHHAWRADPWPPRTKVALCMRCRLLAAESIEDL